MSSTLTALYFHIVFGTKNRTQSILPAHQPDLHRYISGIIKNLNGHVHEIGGMPDHIHLLLGLTPSHCLKDVVREIKKSSSLWMHRDRSITEFAWQDGYAAFSVSPSAVDSVARYIRNQEEHHRVKSFREELVEFYKAAGISYDPKYLEDV